MTADNKLPHDIHDRGYKLLFSFWKILQQLIEGYVQEEWKDRLDFSNSQKIDSSFISERLEKQESDILYKVPFLEKKDKQIYLYLLIEHQSSIDYSMPFRVLFYLAQVWNHFYKNSDEKKRRQKDFCFPPVFPIVLYNGSTPWTAATSLKQIVEEADYFHSFIPDVTYYLIDIPRLDIAKLRDINNTLSAVFLLERDTQTEELEDRLHEVLSIVDSEPNDALWCTVIEWIKMFLKREYREEVSKFLDEIDVSKHNRQEVKAMLETMPKKLIAYGEEKGQKKGLKQSILDVLEIRFVSIPEDISSKIEVITDIEQLRALHKKSVIVKTLDEFLQLLPQEE